MTIDGVLAEHYNVSVKTCTKCGEAKAEAEFHNDRSRPDGKFAWCKVCNYRNVRKHIEANPGATKAYKAAWYQANRERVLADQTLRRPPGSRGGEGATLYKANPELFKAKARNWRLANPDKHRQNVIIESQRRRARKAGAVNDFTAEQWRQTQADFGFRCAYCWTRPAKLTMDHAMPLARGGGHTLSNILPACLSCNSGKCDRTISEFLEYRKWRLL